MASEPVSHIFLRHARKAISYLGEIDPFFGLFIEHAHGIVDYEKPDAYILADTALFIIEHFEFDNTKTERGSEGRKEQARVDKAFQKMQPTDTGSRFCDEINAECKMDYFVQNAVDNFEKHRKKIETYKEHLINDGILSNRIQMIKTVFLMEDTSAIGTYSAHDGNPVLISKCKSFLDVFENQNDVDYCLCAFFKPIEFGLMVLDKASIPLFREQQIDDKLTELVDTRPQVRGFKQYVSIDNTDR